MKRQAPYILIYLAVYAVLFFLIPWICSFNGFTSGKYIYYGMLFLGNLIIPYFLSKYYAKKFGFRWFLPVMPAMFFIACPLFYNAFFGMFGFCYIGTAYFGAIYEKEGWKKETYDGSWLPKYKKP